MTEQEMDLQIQNVVSKSDYKKGKKYTSDKIRFITKSLINNTVYLAFSVNDENWWYYNYKVLIGIQDKKIVHAECNCSYEGQMGSCKHIAAVLEIYKQDIFNVDLNKIIKELSKNVIDQLKKETPNTNKINKEELELDVVFTIDQGETFVYLKVGNTQKYVLKQKTK